MESEQPSKRMKTFHPEVVSEIVPDCETHPSKRAKTEVSQDDIYTNIITYIVNNIHE